MIELGVGAMPSSITRLPATSPHRRSSLSSATWSPYQISLIDSSVCPLASAAWSADGAALASLVVHGFRDRLRCAVARAVVDHRLARRHLINEYRRGRLRQDQVCDAHPELIRAARNVGTPASMACPICGEPSCAW